MANVNNLGVVGDQWAMAGRRSNEKHLNYKKFRAIPNGNYLFTVNFRFKDDLNRD